MGAAVLKFAETRGTAPTPGIAQLDREQDLAIRAGARQVAEELDTIQAAITAATARARTPQAALEQIKRQARKPELPIAGDDLAEALAGVILGGLVVGRYHALRDVFEPTLLFAERIPKLPSSWSDDRIVRRALSFLEGKDLLTPAQFAKLSDSARHGAFKIAGVTRKTMLDIARREVQRGIRAGESATEVGFRLNRKFAAQGYQPLRPWHAELVAEQNFLGAYGAASWEALHDPRVAPLIPFFRYVTMADERVRPTHAVFHNRFYRRDNPIWNTIWPPNGFRCRCKVVGVTVNTVNTYGIREDRVPQYATVVKGGKQVRVRALPDEGFRSNPRAYLSRQARAAK